MVELDQSAFDCESSSKKASEEELGKNLLADTGMILACDRGAQSKDADKKEKEREGARPDVPRPMPPIPPIPPPFPWPPRPFPPFPDDPERDKKDPEKDKKKDPEKDKKKDPPRKKLE